MKIGLIPSLPSYPSVLGVEFRALHRLGKCSTIELLSKIDFTLRYSLANLARLY